MSITAILEEEGGGRVLSNAKCMHLFALFLSFSLLPPFFDRRDRRRG